MFMTIYLNHVIVERKVQCYRDDFSQNNCLQSQIILKSNCKHLMDERERFLNGFFTQQHLEPSQFHPLIQLAHCGQLSCPILTVLGNFVLTFGLNENEPFENLMVSGCLDILVWKVRVGCTDISGAFCILRSSLVNRINESAIFSQDLSESTGIHYVLNACIL